MKLYRDGTLIDSVDGTNDAYTVDSKSGSITTTLNNGNSTTAGYYFDNILSNYNKINAGFPIEFVVKADIKAVNGNSFHASIANADIISVSNFPIYDSNGDQILAGSANRIGSAVGNDQNYMPNSVSVVVGSATMNQPTYDNNGNKVSSATWIIPLTLTANGQTQYIGKSVQLATTASGQNAFAVTFFDGATPNTADTVSSAILSILSSDATSENNGYRLDVGTARHFTLTATMTSPVNADHQYGVWLQQIQTFTDSGLTSGITDQTLLPIVSFKTGLQQVHN